ncbi:preprotein translocase subunit SecE [Ammoniphilus oxalaticus]|uniref:Protein translocase subunit SecE n=1 Tax=Ammoniphilus oxalaticus TaxID=66863 RepID=A0A419SG78_9BACL|nr:preprotein translocase subunit SecE [Ammoniphilus oxalaticus]RKD22755.1 preprotein translocase subunit SecE [Ammoniphilus oxalaticus]
MGFLGKIGAGFKNTPSFLRDVWVELKRVRWPSRKELVSYTTVVLVTVTLITVFFAVIDLGISQIIELILGQ